MIICQICLLLLGAIIYLRKPQFVFLFWLSFTPFAILLFSWGLNIYARDDLASLQFYITGLTRNYFGLLIIIALCKRKKIPNITNLVALFFTLSIFFALHSYMNVFNKNIISANISEISALILPLLFLMIDKEAIPSQKNLLTYIFILLGIEALAAYLNTHGIYFYKASYISAYSASLQNSYDYEKSLVSGTFPRYNMLGNYISTIFVFFTLEFLSKKKKNTKAFIFGSLIMLSIIALSGAKMSLFLAVLILSISLIIYGKKNIGLSFLFFIGIALCFNFLLQYHYNMEQQSDRFAGLFRQIEGFASLAQKSHDGSTASISTYLLSKYFFHNPFLGNGLAANGEYAYGFFAYVGLTEFKADARIAFILVEYGIIGFLLYALLLKNIYNILSKNLIKGAHIKLIICFIYFSILTITEPGFFDRVCFPMVYIYVFAFLKKENNTPKINSINQNTDIIM